MKLLDLRGAAEFLTVKDAWLKEHVRARTPDQLRVPCIRLGRLLRFRQQDLEAFVNRLAGETSVAAQKKNLRAIS